MPTPTFDLPTLAQLRSRRSRKWLSDDPEVIGASIAETDFGTAPVVRQALRDAIHRQQFGYQTSELAGRMCEATAGWLGRRYAWSVSPSAVRPVADVLRALDLAIVYLSRAGSPVILPTPAYSPFLTLPARFGREVIEVPMLVRDGRYELDLAGVDAAFEAGGHLLVLCNPHNPTGTVHTPEELCALAGLVERRGGRVFSDEVHAPLTYGDATHVPYASLGPVAAGHAVTAHSASKAWNLPGLKCAQVVLTSDADVAVWAPLAIESHGASNMGLIATTAAYDHGERWLAEVIRYLDGNRRAISEVTDRLGGAVRYREPDATFLAWLDWRPSGIPDPGGRLGGRSVTVVEGSDCGGVGHGHCRVNFATPRPVLDELLERLAAIVDSSSP